jgi:hypothetical protein
MTLRLLEGYRDQSSIYEHFSPDGRLHLVCPHCRGLVLLFENLTPSDRSNVARLRRSNPAQATKLLIQVSGCDLRHAKAIILHLRDADSRCHKCQHPIPRGALLCSQCMSVNLDW